MNAALRAIVRVCVAKEVSVLAIKNGWKGLINNDFKALNAEDVASILQKGGTSIGSARCMEFKTTQGRLTGCQNLIHKGVNNIIAIGGDGTLTGANIFREDWVLQPPLPGNPTLSPRYSNPTLPGQFGGGVASYGSYHRSPGSRLSLP